MAITSPLGAKLRTLRSRRRLTQEQLARLAECERANISRYEAGKKVPTLDTLARLAKALNTTPSKLLV